jgi:rod shape-determining protein MreD
VDRPQLIAAGKVALLLAIGVVLQVLVVSQIRVLGVTADLFLILTLVVAIGRGPLWGCVFGFFVGLCADVAFFQPLGMHALIYLLTGYCVGLVVSRLVMVTPWMVFLIAGVSSFASQFVFGLFQYIMGPHGAFLVVVANQMLPEMVLDALITVPIFLLVLRLRIIRGPAAPLSPTSSPTRTEAG